MNRRFHRFLSVTCLVAFGAVGRFSVAQHPQQPAQPASSGGSSGSITSQSDGLAFWIPHSADEVTETIQTLADGAKITNKRVVKVFQDSKGRTRRENFDPELESVGQTDFPQSIRITDPDAGVSYYLNPRDHTAQKTDMRRRTPSPAAQTTGASVSPALASPESPRPTHEDLGTRVIEGIEARGERITRTVPAGAVGNDQPLQITEEVWGSARPRFLLIRITNDPRYGETVMRLTNLVLEEPSPDLFQVPPDYTVQELQPVAKPASPSD